MKCNLSTITLVSLLASGVHSFAPPTRAVSSSSTQKTSPLNSLPKALWNNPQDDDGISSDEKSLFNVHNNNSNNSNSNNSNSNLASLATISAATAGILFTAAPAEAADSAAATADNFFTVKSALAAYVHYLSLLVSIACLMTERLTVSTEMTDDEETRLSIVDTIWGLAGVALAVSGYFRVVDFGKGWDFYSHEPIFWLKLTLLGVLGGASFFPTTIYIKRIVERDQKGSVPPMSQALVDRLRAVINAELLALFSIPLAATLMSRGVLYDGEFPWQAGAAVVALTFGGVGFKYIKEGLTWEEPAALVTPEE